MSGQQQADESVQTVTPVNPRRSRRDKGSPPLPVAVFHPGTQHSWQTALALQRLNRLAWYATSIYYQPDRWPYKLADFVPNTFAERLRAEFRRFRQAELDPSLVRTVGAIEWIERLAARSNFKMLASRLDIIGNRRFTARLSRDIAGPQSFALWGYNGSSLGAFEQGRKHDRFCILDRTIGDSRAYNQTMDAVAQTHGDWFLPTQRHVPASVTEMDDREYELADLILVGSSFAERTVRQNARDAAVAGKLRVLPYCYDDSLFGAIAEPRLRAHDQPVKFLFVGHLSPRKGVHHVLEAIERVPASAAELTLVGELAVPKRIFARFADRVSYIPTVPRAEIPAVMAAHDVLLFPSYFEGSALSLLEGLASGLALIQTEQAGNGVTPETGIMLGAPDTDLLHDAMMTAIEDRQRLDGWRLAAQAEARNYSFVNYCSNIVAMLDEELHSASHFER